MIRVVLVAGFFFTSLPFMIAVQWVLGRLNSKYWGPASVAYYRLLCRALRINVTINGAPVRGRPVLTVSNHVSWVDIVVLASVAPMVFIAKREVASWPLIGAAARVQKVVFVDRTRRQQTGDAVREIAQRLRGGHPVVLFAEGTSGDGNHVLPFRTALIGAVEAACNDAGLGEVLLQPMSICYTAQQGMAMTMRERPIVAWYGDLDFFPHFTAFIRRGVVDVSVSFGTAIAADASHNRKEVTKALETAVRHMTVVASRHALPVTS
ncbi:MAG: Acyl-CoA:1-acyl-sn-glycerol-3-phosphate acyltransferase [Pseudolabrys sp.]|jgi:1-acyl-sn-glycerol-3-phosphate acyltransferase|nr:Acyl-CoA:1-acyl-sn-glycerol-3-phosphate acyltransferase [Pseudolabrys sp.]